MQVTSDSAAPCLPSSWRSAKDVPACTGSPCDVHEEDWLHLVLILGVLSSTVFVILQAAGQQNPHTQQRRSIPKQPFLLLPVLLLRSWRSRCRRARLHDRASLPLEETKLSTSVVIVVLHVWPRLIFLQFM